MEEVVDKTERYRQIIQSYLTRFASIPNLEEGIQDRLLFDLQNDSYAVIAEGWDGEERVHFVVAHLEIINGKIWIQADNTDVVNPILCLVSVLRLCARLPNTQPFNARFIFPAQLISNHDF
jgi:hypothetical protein